MPGPPYLTPHGRTCHSRYSPAQNAAKALIALGWSIQPHGDDMDRWRIGDLVMTDEKLIGFAMWRGIWPVNERVHQLMAKEPPQTIGDLRRETIILDEEIAEAVEAYFADPKLNAFRFASGHILDLVAAVDAHEPARATIAKKRTLDFYRRSMVRTAVILATPTMKWPQAYLRGRGSSSDGLCPPGPLEFQLGRHQHAPPSLLALYRRPKPHEG